MRRATAISVAALACVFLGAPSGHAQEGSALSPPPLTLSVTTSAGGGWWKLKVENTGDVPVRLAADPRLLVLEVTPPAGTELEPAAAKKRPISKKTPDPVTLRCALPDDARPVNDEGHDLVIPAKRSWSTSIDPLFYCFGSRERRALVTGAIVKAHFGWPAPVAKSAGGAAKKKPAAPTPPFAAAPVGAAVGKVAPAKDLESAPFTLTDTLASAVPSAPAAAPSSPGRAVLNVSMPESRDVARGIEIETTVTVANDGDQAAIFLWRPETVRFNVAGPLGSSTCGTTAVIDSPIRELYSTLGPKRRSSMALLVTAKCPVDTFDEPGVFRVTAILDTSQASARPVGLKTWDGEATAAVPMLLRVRSLRRPGSTTRPTLD